MFICNEKSSCKSWCKGVNRVNFTPDLHQKQGNLHKEKNTKLTNIITKHTITNKSNKHLHHLHDLHDNPNNNSKQWISLLYNEDYNLKGQMFQFGGRWWSLFDLDDPVNRTICSNEFCFDIDVEHGKVFSDEERWDKVRTLAENLKKTLRELDINTELWFYSGRNLHCSIFFDKNITYPFEIMLDYIKKCSFDKFTTEDLKKLAKDMRFAIFKYIVANVEKVDGVEFDFGVMNSTRHMIRFCGAENEKTGYYKSYLNVIPEKEPCIKESQVNFPKEIKYVKNIPDPLLFLVYDRYVEKRDIKKKYIGIGKERRWIEDLLNKPIPDGRHRTVDLILVPYLVSKGLCDNEICDIIMKWYSKCLDLHKGSTVKVVNGKRIHQAVINRSYIVSKISYVRKNSRKTISRKKVTWINN